MFLIKSRVLRFNDVFLRLTTLGMQGGEDTFGDDYQFTKDLRNLVAEALPKIDVRVIVYPKYETRGDLGECVSHFRDWCVEFLSVYLSSGQRDMC